MKIIHTFWTQNKNMNPLLNKGGWLTNEAHFMCWALSCLNAKKYYGSIELFTDEEGYDLFVNKLQLPYDKVNVIFDKKFSEKINGKLWSLAKIYTYGKQEEPFIHIDGDFILWDKINFETDLLFQNKEIDFDLYNDAFITLGQNIDKKIEYFDANFANISYNMGIFGCKNLKFSKYYYNEVFNLLQHIQISKISDLTYINILLEQNLIYYLSEKLQISHKTIHPDIEKDFNKNYKKIFFNIPSSEFMFNHFLGGSKKLESVNNYVCEELFINFPEYYNKLKNLISKDYQCEYYYVTKQNIEFDSERIKNDLINKLSKYGLMLYSKYKEDFTIFFNNKYFLLDKIDSIKNIFKPHSKKKLNLLFANEPSKISIRFSNNFLMIKNYFHPWDVFFNNTMNDLTESNSEQFKKVIDSSFNKPYYCIFYYTPFSGSIATYWVKDIGAFLMAKIISKEYKTFEIIIFEFSKLIKNSSKDNNYLKKILVNLITKLYNYGFLEVQKN